MCVCVCVCVLTHSFIHNHFLYINISLWYAFVFWMLFRGLVETNGDRWRERESRESMLSANLNDDDDICFDLIIFHKKL